MISFDKLNIKKYAQHIDWKIILISIVWGLSILYYINPLDNVQITGWDRTFSPAALSGISIDARIGNFYTLFLLFAPGIILLLIGILTILFKFRALYKEHYLKISILFSAALLASYISRYTSNSVKIGLNPLLQCILGFLIILTVISLVDYQQKLKFEDITILFLAFVTIVLLLNMFLHFKNELMGIVWAGVIVLLFTSCLVLLPLSEKIIELSKRFVCLLFWLPLIARIGLEGLFFLTERGYNITQYYTYIRNGCLAFIAIILFVVFFSRNKKWNFTTIGYIGAIASITTLCYFSIGYQYVWSFSSFANVYELGNKTVAADTIWHGKLPIIDYFSAHAISDVWTRILYCLLHNDINGIFANPYDGLSYILCYVILYYIIKQIFDKDISAWYVLLFPGIVSGIKWASITGLTIVLLVHMFKKPKAKSYFLFWLGTLLCAFYIYDEGISIGIACIIAFIIITCINKEWKQVKQFLLCGICVAACSMGLYIIYALITKLPIMSRIKEWLAVSVDSSSSWATASFGDQSSFAFVLSYFIVPTTAVALLVFTIFIYIKTKKNPLFVLLTTVYSLTEILYITRSIVFHNLAVCSGVTGVLLNFIHWTVSIYVLYRMTERNRSLEQRLFAWISTMLIVIIVEGAVVTKKMPSVNSSLLTQGITSSARWDLQDDYSENIGKKRIIPDEATNNLISQFRGVFDTLLLDNETFLDFANATSIYVMTGRERPFYVGQSPSLLTNLYSQDMYIEEVGKYNCPLVVIGTTSSDYLAQMGGIPHNIRYYKIAEYIYNRYRPLVAFGEFTIWCENDKYELFRTTLQRAGFDNPESGYSLIDYGYDFTTTSTDDNGNIIQWNFKPYHSYDLGEIPFIWANNDHKKALENNVLISIESTQPFYYRFDGSQKIDSNNGNYVVFEYTNTTDNPIRINADFYDSTNSGALFEYYFTVKPGKNQYLIRVSEDYFWDVYNIDTIHFGANDNLSVSNVRVLEGD